MVPLAAGLPRTPHPLVLARVRGHLVAKVTPRTLFEGLVTGCTKLQDLLVDLHFGGQCANLSTVAALFLLVGRLLGHYVLEQGVPHTRGQLLLAVRQPRGQIVEKQNLEVCFLKRLP